MTKYELERMPVTETGQRMYSRVSPIYERSRFMKIFYDALGAEWEPLRKFFMTLREQHFIDTVDWGIEYLEHKYSLEPRPDLSLEERRARLGIKARRHLPLNPGVMESHILDNYSLEVYLSEREPGYIHLFANWLTDLGWRKAIKWLVDEKPAHLVLDATLHLVSYTGEPPEEFLPVDKIITPGEVPLPKTPEDKKYFRKIHAGSVLATGGSVNVELRKPRDSVAKIYAGNFTLTDGHVTINPRSPSGSQILLKVGAPLVIGGQVLIDSAVKPILRRAKENPIADLAIADVAIARGDNLVIPDAYDFIKIFFKFPNGTSRRYITIKNPREDVTKAQIKAVGDYAVDNDLLLNQAHDEIISDAPRASLIKKKITVLI